MDAVPQEDFASSGFSAIWLADYSGLRNGMHREIEPLGLLPEQFRTVIRRSDHDMMAIHYSETADASAKMQGIMSALDPLGTKRRTKVSNSAEKVSNSDSDF